MGKDINAKVLTRGPTRYARGHTRPRFVVACVCCRCIFEGINGHLKNDEYIIIYINIL